MPSLKSSPKRGPRFGFVREKQVQIRGVSYKKSGTHSGLPLSRLRLNTGVKSSGDKIERT